MTRANLKINLRLASFMVAYVICVKQIKHRPRPKYSYFFVSVTRKFALSVSCFFLTKFILFLIVAYTKLLRLNNVGIKKLSF